MSSGCTNARTDVAAGAADRWTSRTAAVRRAVHTAAHVGQPGRLVFLNAKHHTALRVTTVEPRDASRWDAEVRPLPDPAVTADDLPKHHSRALHTKFFAHQESSITN